MAPALHICGGLRGYRLAFIGPDRFEVVGEFPTFAEAAKAKREAEKASELVAAAMTRGAR